LSYLRVGIADEAEEDVSEHFAEAFAVIEEARLLGGACLVHCSKGMSRSAILILAFLVAHCNLSAACALQLLQQKRQYQLVSPNPGFLNQLLELELRVRGCISLDAAKVSTERCQQLPRASVQLCHCTESVPSRLKVGINCR
jgi:predicted protein tyrosine phosphatase